jgi:RNA polymerase sigma factor (sigma-70 family)
MDTPRRDRSQTMRDPEDILQHKVHLETLARRLAQDPAEQDELVWETLGEGTLQPPEHEGVRAWLSRILRNRAANQRRARRRRESHEAAAARGDHHLATSDLAARLELFRHLAEHVETLPEIYRDAILLRYFEDLPPREIAVRTGEKLATIKSRLQRALEMLRQRLDAEYDSRQKWIGLCMPLGLRPMMAAGAAAGTVTLWGIMSLKHLVVIGTALVAVLVLVTLEFVTADTDPQRRIEDPATGRQAQAGDVNGARAALGREDVPSHRKPVASQETQSRPRIQGVVVDATQRPIPGAHVILCDQSARDTYQDPLDFIRTLELNGMGMIYPGHRGRGTWFKSSDDQGRFSFDYPGRCEQWHLICLHEDHGIHFTEPAEDPPEDLVVQLPDWRSLSATVVSKGQPLEGATVSISMKGVITPLLSNVLTDAKGRFKTSCLPHGEYFVQVRSKGHLSKTVRDVRLSPTHSGELAPIVLIAIEPLRIALHGPDGEPLQPAALFSMTGTSHEHLQATLCRRLLPSLSTYSPAGLISEALQIAADGTSVHGQPKWTRATRHLAIWKDRQLYAHAVLGGPDQKTAKLELAHLKQGKLCVHVFLTPGSEKLAPQLTLRATALGGFGLQRKQESRRAPDGSTEYDLTLDRLYVLSATAKGHESQAISITPTDGVVSVSLRLRPLSKSPLTGIVLDDQGKPLARARVHVMLSKSAASFADACFARTDKQGKFSIPNIGTGGEAYLLVTGRGFASRRVSTGKEKLRIGLERGTRIWLKTPESPLALVVSDRSGGVLRDDRLQGSMRNGSKISLRISSQAWRITATGLRGQRWEALVTQRGFPVLELQPVH